MNTIKMGGRTWQVEFGDDIASVGGQITKMLRHTRLRQIESVMHDLPTYVQCKHDIALSAAQLSRVWNTLMALQLQDITTAIYRRTVAAARAKPFTVMSIEPFSSEIDRAIRLELNNPQLALQLDAVGEKRSPAPVDYRGLGLVGEEHASRESPGHPVNISQLILPLAVTD